MRCFGVNKQTSSCSETQRSHWYVRVRQRVTSPRYNRSTDFVGTSTSNTSKLAFCVLLHFDVSVNDHSRLHGRTGVHAYAIGCGQRLFPRFLCSRLWVCEHTFDIQRDVCDVMTVAGMRVNGKWPSACSFLRFPINAGAPWRFQNIHWGAIITYFHLQNVSAGSKGGRGGVAIPVNPSLCVLGDALVCMCLTCFSHHKPPLCIQVFSLMLGQMISLQSPVGRSSVFSLKIFNSTRFSLEYEQQGSIPQCIDISHDSLTPVPTTGCKPLAEVKRDPERPRGRKASKYRGSQNLWKSVSPEGLRSRYFATYK